MVQPFLNVVSIYRAGDYDGKFVVLIKTQMPG